MEKETLSITQLINEEVSTRRKLINYIKHGKWLNDTWDRDNTIYIEQGEISVMLRLGRELNDNFTMVGVVQKLRVADDDWDDFEWVNILEGKMENINEIITMDMYDNLILILKNIMAQGKIKIDAQMGFKELSGWIIVEGHCATRILRGGDINNPHDMVAFIEKTPRVKVRKNKYSIDSEDGISGEIQKRDAWIYGFKDSEYGMSEKSRKWCDEMLSLLGYE